MQAGVPAGKNWRDIHRRARWRCSHLGSERCNLQLENGDLHPEIRHGCLMFHMLRVCLDNHLTVMVNLFSNLFLLFDPVGQLLCTRQSRVVFFGKPLYFAKSGVGDPAVFLPACVGRKEVLMGGTRWGALPRGPCGPSVKPPHQHTTSRLGATASETLGPRKPHPLLSTRKACPFSRNVGFGFSQGCTLQSSMKSNRVTSTNLHQRHFDIH